MKTYFLRPKNSLLLETTKGTIEINANEYFELNDPKNGRNPLVINKAGIQKIEDTFDVTTEIIGEGVLLDNIYVKVRMTTPHGFKVERLGSANNKNLSNEIARAYAIEMSFKRACATAALEILRRNYTGKEPLPLLYSSFDEFKTEESINENVAIEQKETETPQKVAKKQETKAEKPAKKETSAKAETPVKNETPTEAEVPVQATADSDFVETNAAEENPFKEKEQPKAEPEAKAETKPEVKPEEPKNETITSNLGSFTIKSNKYRAGITLQELANKDKNYLNWLVNGDNMRGRYKEYQEKAREFVEQENIKLA